VNAVRKTGKTFPVYRANLPAMVGFAPASGKLLPVLSAAEDAQIEENSGCKQHSSPGRERHFWVAAGCQTI
jgi:hypothetical protein